MKPGDLVMCTSQCTRKEKLALIISYYETRQGYFYTIYTDDEDWNRCTWSKDAMRLINAAG